MVDLVYYLTNLLFFNIISIYYYINLRLSIIFCLSSEDIYLSLGISIGISLSCSFVTVFELFCCQFIETPVTLLEMLLPISSPVASVVYWYSIIMLLY